MLYGLEAGVVCVRIATVVVKGCIVGRVLGTISVKALICAAMARVNRVRAQAVRPIAYTPWRLSSDRLVRRHRQGCLVHGRSALLWRLH